MAIKLLIADDDPLIRESLKIILDLDKDFEVLASVENGLLAADFCKRNEIDIALLDIRMPILNGVQAVKEIRSKTGYLPSEVNFTENIRAIELLKYSQEFYKKDCSERIYELSSRLNLDLNKKLDDFSLGNRKKVGIVQAIMHSPEFLILDEPTSGLDPLIQKNFFDLLLEERKKGTTILFSSHVLSEVQKYCDRVAIIKEGRLLKITTVDALTASSYKNISIVTASGEHLDYMFEGDLNELIIKISEIKIKDIKIEEPSLEEIFLKYYEKEIV
jgi:ABC-2 type transport system ATP-binding protein